MILDDLIQRPLLDDALEQGYVRQQTHPELPLAILNYTERAAYDSIWNEATLTCRGLIYDERDRRILARPFPKFFNYGQPGAPELDLDAPALVTEKMDGSLGILYPLRVKTDGLFLHQIDGWAIATRGSFASDQAIHATEVLRERYGDVFLDVYATYLFEIVYPENRIVCDYGDLDDLILLARLDTDTGAPAQESPRYRWPGPRVETHPYRSLGEALAAEPRPGKEGLVVYLPDVDARVKIKQEDYVALHRIVTGLNKRTVWEHLGAGKPIEDLIEPLPDEFRPWVEDVVAELSATVASQARAIEQEFEQITGALSGVVRCDECGGDVCYVTYRDGLHGSEIVVGGWECTTAGGCGSAWKPLDDPAALRELRKAFAERAKDFEYAWALFQRLDGKDYGPKLWHLNRPDPETPAGRVYTEDVA